MAFFTCLNYWLRISEELFIQALFTQIKINTDNKLLNNSWVAVIQVKTEIPQWMNLSNVEQCYLVSLFPLVTSITDYTWNQYTSRMQ